MPIAVETLSHGRSLGKLACGLRVVRDDGGPIRFRHALVRGAIGVVEILMTFGVVACIASLVSARGRRLGDVFAGTLVVRERVPAARADAGAASAAVAGRAVRRARSVGGAGRSVAGDTAVPDADAASWTRQVGWSMAERLAGDLAARTGAPAPQGVPPAAYLAAVVHERQARDARRAFGGGATAVAAPGRWPAVGRSEPAGRLRCRWRRRLRRRRGAAGRGAACGRSVVRAGRTPRRVPGASAGARAPPATGVRAAAEPGAAASAG